jgi:Kef-type K+ transport system membrane component KefB
MPSSELPGVFFLQVLFILVACRLAGWFARKIAQPQVVGEMVAGVIIGPSLFGLLLPGCQQMIFPTDSLKILYALAQLGIALYMFLVGTEFKIDLFRSQVRSAVSISIAGIVAPFILGVCLSFWLHSVPGLCSNGIANFEAALFLGAAMSITAFPVLARIIHERGIAGTELGTTTLGASAIDDVVAWCIMAIVIASTERSWPIAIQAIAGGVIYAILMLKIGRKVIGPPGISLPKRK